MVSNTKARSLVRLGSLYVKLTWRRGSGPLYYVSGFEVFSRRPDAGYWVEGYGHEEPPVTTLERDTALPYADGRFLCLWYERPSFGSGVELVGSYGDQKPHHLSSIRAIML